MSTSAARNAGPGQSAIVTLRLLAAATTDVDPERERDFEQLTLPLEWVRVVTPRLRPVALAPVRTAELPEPRAWALRITQAALEVLVGRRSAGQLARHIDARAASSLANHASQYEVRRRRERTLPPPRITSVQVHQPHPDAAEVTIVIQDGERFRAIAMRMEVKAARWIVTAFSIL